MILHAGSSVFFLHIALAGRKTSLTQLYLFGMLFALYESWITKVLWAGYIDAAGPGLGTFLGLGVMAEDLLRLAAAANLFCLAPGGWEFSDDHGLFLFGVGRKRGCLGGWFGV